MLFLRFGVGEAIKIVAFHALDAVLNLKTAYVEMAANCGAGNAALLRYVHLPEPACRQFSPVRG